MNQRLFQTSIVAAAMSAAVLLTSCSSSSTNTASTQQTSESAAPKAPQGPISAKTAFWEMYKPAFQWSKDIMPIQVTNHEVATTKTKDGKATVWTAIFVSPQKGESRTYTYATIDDPANDITKGVKASAAMPWSGPTANVMPFQTSEFTVDSDAAYAAAKKKADAWLAQHPEESADLTLGKASRFNQPVWMIYCGNDKNGYRSYVDAATGEIITK